jgi:hypothetical protein
MGVFVRLRAFLIGFFVFAAGLCALHSPLARIAPLKLRRIHTTRRKFNFVPRLASLRSFWESHKAPVASNLEPDLYAQIATLSEPTSFSEDKLKSVQASLDALEKSEPISAFLVEAKLIVAIVQNNPEEIERWLLKASEVYPEKHLAEYYRAKIAFLEGDRDEAIQELTSVVETTEKFDPEIANALSRLNDQIYMLRGWDPFTLMTTEERRGGNAWYR